VSKFEGNHENTKERKREKEIKQRAAHMQKLVFASAVVLS